MNKAPFASTQVLHCRLFVRGIALRHALTDKSQSHDSHRSEYVNIPKSAESGATFNLSDTSACMSPHVGTSCISAVSKIHLP